jgi:hypothetical protein
MLLQGVVYSKESSIFGLVMVGYDVEDSVQAKPPPRHRRWLLHLV